MNEVINAISNIGFPVFCTVVLFNLYNKTITEFRQSLDKNTDALIKLQELIIAYIKRGDNK